MLRNCYLTVKQLEDVQYTLVIRYYIKIIWKLNTVSYIIQQKQPHCLKHSKLVFLKSNMISDIKDLNIAFWLLMYIVYYLHVNF